MAAGFASRTYAPTWVSNASTLSFVGDNISLLPQNNPMRSQKRILAGYMSWLLALWKLREAVRFSESIVHYENFLQPLGVPAQHKRALLFVVYLSGPN